MIRTTTKICVVFILLLLLSSAVLAITPKEINVVIYGDSIASGRSGSYFQPFSNSTNNTVYFNSTYTNQWGSLAYFIEQNATFTNITASNYAKYGQFADLAGGKTYRDALGYDIPMYDGIINKTLFTTLNRKPTVVIIDVGINDVSYNRSLTEIKNSIYDIVLKSEQHRVPCVVFTLNPPGDYTWALANVSNINSWMATNLTTNNVIVFDSYTFFDNGAGAVKSDYDWGDGMHVVPEGYAAIEPFITSEINNVILRYKSEYNNPILSVNPFDVAVMNWNYSVTEDATGLQTWTSSGIARASPTVFKWYNGSAEFNTTSSYISSSNTSGFKFLHDGSTHWTIHMWTKIPVGGFASSRFFFDTGGSSVAMRGIATAVTSGYIPYIQISNGTGVDYPVAGTFGGAQYPNDGNWNYLEYSFNGTHYNAAINGSFVGSLAKGSIYSSSDASRVYIGSTGSVYTNGFIDDFVVSKNVTYNTYKISDGEYSSRFAPMASFYSTSVPAFNGIPVSFVDTSTGSPTSWDWGWGDGTANGTTQNPSHTYTSTGLYQVFLNASNNYGFGSAYFEQSVINSTSFTQQDIEMEPEYTLLLHITDAADNTAIPITTITTADGQTNITSTGTATFFFPYGTAVVYVSSNGYDSASANYLMDANREETIQLTKSESTTQNANIIWSPSSVAIQVLDSNRNPIIGTPVYISAHSSSLPGGISGAIEYFKGTYGVTEATARVMFNDSTTYYGTTDDNGFVATQVVDIIQYRIVVQDVYQINETRLMWPAGPYYQIVTLNATTTGIGKQGIDQNLIYTTSDFNTTFWEPNTTHSCMGVKVYDATGQTTFVYAWWKLIDNGTVWSQNTTGVGGYGPVNSTMCIEHIPYQQWRWGGITG